MRIVFFGTSEFATPTLRAIAEEPALELVLVVTQPDSRAGRGRKVAGSPVAGLAEELGLPVTQPELVSNEQCVQQLREARADLFLTAAYGQKLSEEILALPKQYALNLHGSLLPRHRGAAPAQHAILAGDDTTGVTLMGMTSRIDAGPVYASKETPILEADTGGTLLERLAEVARDLFLECAGGLDSGTLEPVAQDEAAATRAKALKKEDGRMPWQKTAKEIDRHVRAMTPWPSAFTFCPTDRSPARVLVVSGDVLDVPSPAMPGTVVAFTSGIEVATRKGVYRLMKVKRSGKRSLSAVEFLRGFPMPVGSRLQ